MASQVEIANAALQKLGSSAITSFSDSSKGARECTKAYDRLREKLLRQHLWRFAIKRVQLPALSDVPLFGYERQFQLPADFLRLAPRDLYERNIQSQWQIEGRRIITNDDAPLNVRYIWSVSDPNVMDSIFRDLLAVEMAHEMCESLTNSNVKLANLKQERKDTIAEARRINAWETPPIESPAGSWITARFTNPHVRPGVIDKLGV